LAKRIEESAYRRDVLKSEGFIRENVVTIPRATLLASTIIALAIIGSQFLAPYRLATGTAVAWRLNVISGEVRLCNFEIDVRNPPLLNACR